MPLMEGVRWGVQVTVDMGNGTKQIWARWLDKPLPQVPFPGDVVVMTGAQVATEMTGIDDEGSVSLSVRRDGARREIALEVDTRLWREARSELMLLCWPYPGDSDLDPVDIVADLDAIGFEPAN